MRGDVFHNVMYITYMMEHYDCVMVFAVKIA